MFWIRYPEKGLDDNYCRNPDGRHRPWCFTTDPNTPWEYCNIKVCGKLESMFVYVWLNILAFIHLKWKSMRVFAWACLCCAPVHQVWLTAPKFTTSCTFHFITCLPLLGWCRVPLLGWALCYVFSNSQNVYFPLHATYALFVVLCQLLTRGGQTAQGSALPH